MDKVKTIYRVIILGNSKTGKTSFLQNINGIPFSEEQVSTIGIDTFMIEKKDKNNNQIYLKLHDTSGQEAYRSLAINLLKNNNAIIFFYDITNENSFGDIKNRWFPELENNIKPDNILIFLIGNKTDLDSERCVSYEEGENFAKSNNMEFFEISAKTSKNVQEVVYSLTNNLVQKFGYKTITTEKKGESIINLTKKEKKKKKNCMI